MKQKEVEDLLTKAREAERLLRQFDDDFELGHLVEHSIVLYDGRLTVPWDEELPDANYSGLEQLILDLRDKVAEASEEGNEKELLRHLGVLVSNGYWRSKADIALVASQIKTMKEVTKGYIGLGYSGAKRVLECLDGANRNRSSIYSGPLDLSIIVQDLCKGRVIKTNYARSLSSEYERIEKLFGSALDLYESREYSIALIKFEEVTKIDASRFISDTEGYEVIKEGIALAHFYLGRCYSEIGNNQRALRKNLKWARAGRWFGWVGKVADAIAYANERLERGDRILRQQY